MRTIVLVVISVALGAGIGAGAARYQFGGFDAASWNAQAPGAPQPAPEGSPQARVVVDDDTHEFGSMELNASGKHDFMFTNAGEAPLRLAVGDTTCQCTVGEVTGEDVLPGQTVPVTLQWTIKSMNSEFRHGATILTNDPARPSVELTVHGSVRRAVVVAPQSLAMGAVRRGASKTTFADIVSYPQAEFKVEGYHWDGVEAADYLEVHIQQLPLDQFADPAAQAAVRVTAALRPGAPTGPLQGWLHVDTDLEAQPRVEIPLSGKVVSDISLSGPGFNSQRDILRLGAVDRDQGKQVRLVAFVRGDHAAQTHIEVEEKNPEFLEVTIGKEALRTERVTQIPIEIRVPEGARPAAFMGEGHGGYGRILLKTSHPDVPQLEIKIRFTVGE